RCRDGLRHPCAGRRAEAQKVGSAFLPQCVGARNRISGARRPRGTGARKADWRVMRFAAALSAVLLLCGCTAFPFMAGPAEPRQVPAGLQFTVQPGAASPGGVTTLSLYNGGSEPIGYNLCAAALEKLGGGLWVPAVSLAK